MNTETLKQLAEGLAKNEKLFSKKMTSSKLLKLFNEILEEQKQEYEWSEFKENYDTVKEDLNNNTYFDVETQQLHTVEYTYDDKFKLCVKKENEELLHQCKQDFFDNYYLPTGWSQDDWKEFLKKHGEHRIPDGEFFNVDTYRIIKGSKKHHKNDFWGICSTDKNLLHQITVALNSNHDKKIYEHDKELDEKLKNSEPYYESESESSE